MSAVPVARAWRDAWSKIDRRQIYDWATDHVDLPAGVYTIAGRFDVQRSRHFIGPFEALFSDAIKHVSVLWPVRMGKTLLADLWLAWVVANDPDPFMWNFCTDTLAKRHAPTRVIPTLRNCEILKELLPTDTRKITKEMIFRNGMPLYIQGPAIGNLTGIGIRYLVEDELWQRSHASHSEAKGRLGDFEKIAAAKELDLSQGGVEGDPMDEEHGKSDQQEWHVECLRCSKYFVPRHTGYRKDGSRWGLIWDKEARDAGGMWNISRVIETLRYECEKCGHPEVDEKRVKTEWNRTGKYVATNPHAEPAHAGFHCFASIDRSWVDLAKELASAQNSLKKGVLEPLIKFTQKRDARAWSDRLLVEKAPERKVVYEVSSTWSEEHVRIMTVDKQGEGLFWVVVRAWSKSGKSRRLYFNRAYGWAEIEALQKTWKVEAQLVLIDSGFEAKGPDGVYAACCRNGWIALKGDNNRKAFIHSYAIKGQRQYIEKSYSPQTWGDPESGTSGQGTRFAKLIQFAKHSINGRLDRLRSSDRWMVPAGAEPALEEEYQKQMNAEYLKKTRDPLTGRVKEEYVCPSHNNHARDCEGMQVVGATILGILPDSLEEAA